MVICWGDHSPCFETQRGVEVSGAAHSKRGKSGLTRYTIASYLLSYLQEPMIMDNLYFLHAYIKKWWDPHFQLLNHVDHQTKNPGFLAGRMAVHYYVMYVELLKLQE